MLKYNARTKLTRGLHRQNLTEGQPLSFWLSHYSRNSKSKSKLSLSKRKKIRFVGTNPPPNSRLARRANHKRLFLFMAHRNNATSAFDRPPSFFLYVGLDFYFYRNRIVKVTQNALNGQKMCRAQDLKLNTGSGVFCLTTDKSKNRETRNRQQTFRLNVSVSRLEYI